MPVLPPMGCNELAELELESVALASSASAAAAAATVAAAQQQQQQHHHHHHGLPPPTAAPAAVIKQPKQHKGGSRKQPKIETLDLSSPPPSAADTNKLGVRSNAKFKKPIVSTAHASGWLAMMDNDAAAYFLGQQQQQQCQPLQIIAPPNTTTAITTTAAAAGGAAAAAAAATPKGEKSGKNSNGGGAAKAESSGARKYYPAPFCSCTGTNQQCYRWGNGGWQSACCTTKISMYPLPMNPKKKGSRVAGRKMSAGAFMKLLDRLTAEGVDVNASVDLRPHWAKHGTNRYVTIK